MQTFVEVKCTSRAPIVNYQSWRKQHGQLGGMTVYCVVLPFTGKEVHSSQWIIFTLDINRSHHLR